MMSFKLNTWLIVGFIVVLSALGFIVYNQFQISARQEAIEKSVVAQKELADNIMRSQSEYATRKDIENFAKEHDVNVKEIKKDLKKLDAEISSVNNVKVISVGVDKTNVESTGTGVKNENPVPKEIECKDGVCENPDKYGYLNEEQKLELTEPFSNGIEVPLGETKFSAWKRNPWSLKLFPREYGVTTVVGTDEERRQYFYNKFSVTVDGKTYDLPISTANTKQTYPMAKFHWFNPSLHAGAVAGSYLNQLRGEFVPNIGINIMSYGKYTLQPDFRILSIGVGYGTSTDKFHLAISPVYYNLGNHLPLINNLYTGPVISVNSKGEPALLFGFAVGL